MLEQGSFAAYSATAFSTFCLSSWTEGRDPLRRGPTWAKHLTGLRRILKRNSTGDFGNAFQVFYWGYLWGIACMDFAPKDRDLDWWLETAFWKSLILRLNWRNWILSNQNNCSWQTRDFGKFSFCSFKKNYILYINKSTSFNHCRCSGRFVFLSVWRRPEGTTPRSQERRAWLSRWPKLSQT